MRMGTSEKNNQNEKNTLSAAEEFVVSRYGTLAQVIIFDAVLAACIILLLVAYFLTWEAVALIVALIVAACSIAVMGAYTRKTLLKEEVVFTREYVLIRNKFGVLKKIHWDFVLNITFYEDASKELFDAPSELFVSYSFANSRNEQLLGSISCRCRREEVCRIQSVIPLNIGGQGVYFTPAGRARWENLEKKHKRYAEHPLYRYSLRARAAWLIVCLETLWQHFSVPLTQQRKELLFFLWQITSCRANEKEREYLQEWLRSYREEREAFPEFTPTEINGMRTIADWTEELNRRIAALPPPENVEQSITKEVLCALLFLAKRVYPPEQYTYDSFRCSETLDETDRIGKLLKEQGMDPPVLQFPVQLYFMVCEGEDRGMSFAVGLPFNGQESYSLYREKGATLPPAASVEGTEGDVYDFLEKIIAPSIAEEDKQEKMHFFKTPASAFRLGICGGVLSGCMLVLYVFCCLFPSETFKFIFGIPVLIIGAVGSGIFCYFFSIHRRMREYEPYPTKWLEALCVFSLAGLYIGFAVHAYLYLPMWEPIGLFVPLVFFGCFAAFFAQGLLIVCAPRRSVAQIEEEKKVKNWQPPLPRLHFVFGGLCFAAALCLICLYASGIYADPLPLAAAVLQIAGMALSGKTVRIDRQRSFGTAGKIKRVVVYSSAFLLAAVGMFLTVFFIGQQTYGTSSGYWLFLLLAMNMTQMIWGAVSVVRTVRHINKKSEESGGEER